MKLHRERTTVIATMLTIFLITLSVIPTWAQQSPRASVDFTLNDKKVSIDYGRPSMRGRKIMGELVPYGQVWRLGANQATHLKTDADLVIGRLNVPKGTYTLWAFPSATGWKLIINKRTGVWGTPYEYEKDELARVDLKVEKLPNPVEQFTIYLDKNQAGGVLRFEWENTRASIPFSEKK